MTKVHMFGDTEDEPKKQLEKAMEFGAFYGCLMADSHLGYSVPVGGVIAYKGKVCVNGVGFDIACGNKAVRLDCDASAIKSNIYREMNEIQSKISFGVGRKNKEKIDHPLFDDAVWDEIGVLKGLKDTARDQLGTVGAGNHYVDVFADEQNRIWVGCHFGSRGLGHSICTHFIKAAGGADGIYATPVVLDDSSDLGIQYLKCMELAGRYAYAGRDWVCQKVADILRGQVLEEVHNHHNYAWKERHFDEDIWVIRKGATPAFPGQKGFVGGSMGDISVILEGVDTQESRDALYSTVHGAGRIMSRTEARGKINRKTGELLSPGKVDRALHDAWIKRVGVELRGGDLDESPYAYKRIETVLDAHKKTIKILHTLTPMGVCMADGQAFDPYKD